MKNLFIAILLFTSASGFSQTIYSTSFSYNKLNYTYEAIQGDSGYINIYCQYSSDQLNNTLTISIISQKSKDTVELWSGKLQTIVDSGFYVPAKLQTKSTTNDSYSILVNNKDAHGYVNISPKNLSAVISQSDLDHKNIAINVYTTSGQFIKSTTSNAYKETLTHGVYLFSSVDTQVIYSGKILVNQ